jgi:hypothetical protein
VVRKESQSVNDGHRTTAHFPSNYPKGRILASGPGRQLVVQTFDEFAEMSEGLGQRYHHFDAISPEQGALFS